MKKIIFIVLICLSVSYVSAQQFEILHINEIENGMAFEYCGDIHDIIGVIIYGNESCSEQSWEVTTDINPNTVIYVADSITILNDYINEDFISYSVFYHGCDINISFYIEFTNLYNYPFADTIIWKHLNESLQLIDSFNANYEYYYSYGFVTCTWSTGETTLEIEVTQPGVYSVTNTNDNCGSATYSVEVRDNVEAYRATVDLRTNKNKVTWQVTPEQAEYITDVKVYRDDVLVGTAPYTNGYFLDAIGSDAAARNYRIVGVSVEGDDCPIPSYEKGTIHTTYYEDVDGNLNMTWNTPYIEEGAQGTLTGYQICKYNPATEEVTVVDQVNASITDYTCNTAAFTGGQATIAAIFDSKDVEDRAFSNLTDHTFAVSEESETNFMVYPNPSNGTFIVEGASNLTIYNTIGQIIAKSHNEEEKHSFSLGSGIYFIKSDEGAVKKIIVE